MAATSVTAIIAGFESKSGLQAGKVLVEANGSIVSLKGNPNRVTKIVMGYTKRYCNKMMRLLRTLKRLKSPAVVKVYQYGVFKADGEWCYYYVMDKLRPLGRGCWFQGDRISGYLGGDPLPSKESGRIKSFVRKARKLNERHSYNDCHGGNIMRTKRGALKFVDLESFTY